MTFTPDLRPVIKSNPVNWSAVVGDNVQFSVGASSPYALSYQWLKNGSTLGGQTTATATLNFVALLDDGAIFVSNPSPGRGIEGEG